jgi:hypothetical protein
MNASGQFQTIAKALNGLNSSSAANAASAIFGREGAASMVQLSRSTGDFSEALHKAAADADIYQRNAQSFARLEIGLDRIKEKTWNLFAGMAEGAAPAIQAIVDKLNHIDLSGIGQKIGAVLSVITEAFKEGTFTKLLVLSIKTGFEIGAQYIIPFTEKLGYELLKVFRVGQDYQRAAILESVMLLMEGVSKLQGIFHNLSNEIAAGFDFAIQKLMAGLASVPKLGAALGLDGFEAESYEKILHDINYKTNPAKPEYHAPSFDQMLKVSQAIGGPSEDAALAYIDADIQERLKAANAAARSILAPFEAMVKGLLTRAEANRQQQNPSNPHPQPGETLEPTKSLYKPEFTDLEKMGAINRSGTNNPALDYARRTADNTQRMVTQLAALAGSLGGGMGDATTNQL